MNVPLPLLRSTRLRRPRDDIEVAIVIDVGESGRVRRCRAPRRAEGDAAAASTVTRKRAVRLLPVASDCRRLARDEDIGRPSLS